MDKKVIVVLGLVAMVAAVALVLVNRGERGVRRSTEPYPFPKLKVKPPTDPKARRTWKSPLRKKIDRLEITKHDKSVTLKRTAVSDKKNDVGTWVLVKPISYPANKSSIRSLLSRLDRLEFWEVITKTPSDFADLHVDDKSGTRLKIFAGNDLLADMVIGKTITTKMGARSQTYTAIRAHDSNTVWKLVGSVSYVLKKELSKWRDPTIIKEQRKAQAAMYLQDTTNGTFLAVTRNPDETDSKKMFKNWIIAASTPVIHSIDQMDLGRLASAISSLRAQEFTDDAKPDQVGLDHPKRRIVVIYKKKTGTPKPTAGAAKDKSKPRAGSTSTAQTKGTKTAQAAKGQAAATKHAAARPGATTAKTAATTAPMKAVTGIPALDKLAADPNYKVYVLLIGKENTKDKKVYVKLQGKKQIFLIRKSSMRMLEKKVLNFRNKTVLSVNPDDVTELTIRHPNGVTHLKKMKGKWTVLEPKGLDLNTSMVERVVKMLKNRFKARKYADTTDPKKTGLNKPTGIVFIGTKHGTREIHVGNQSKKNQWYVQVKGSRNVFIMGSYPLKQIYKESSKWKKIARRPPMRRR